MVEFLDDFSVEYEFEGYRRAYRVQIPGLFAHVHEMGEDFPVMDISSCGLALGLDGDREDFVVNQEFNLDLYMMGKRVLAGLGASVARIMSGGIALEFSGLSMRQEMRLDKLVLEAQKRMIKKKKEMNQEKDDTEET